MWCFIVVVVTSCYSSCISSIGNSCYYKIHIILKLSTVEYRVGIASNVETHRNYHRRKTSKKYLLCKQILVFGFCGFLLLETQHQIYNTITCIQISQYTLSYSLSAQHNIAPHTHTFESVRFDCWCFNWSLLFLFPHSRSACMWFGTHLHTRTYATTATTNAVHMRTSNHHRINHRQTNQIASA